MAVKLLPARTTWCLPQDANMARDRLDAARKVLALRGVTLIGYQGSAPAGCHGLVAWFEGPAATPAGLERLVRAGESMRLPVLGFDPRLLDQGVDLAVGACSRSISRSCSVVATWSPAAFCTSSRVRRSARACPGLERGPVPLMLKPTAPRGCSVRWALLVAALVLTPEVGQAHTNLNLMEMHLGGQRRVVEKRLRRQGCRKLSPRRHGWMTDWHHRRVKRSRSRRAKTVVYRCQDADWPEAALREHTLTDGACIGWSFT